MYGKMLRWLGYRAPPLVLHNFMAFGVTSERLDISERRSVWPNVTFTHFFVNPQAGTLAIQHTWRLLERRCPTLPSFSCFLTKIMWSLTSLMFYTFICMCVVNVVFHLCIYKARRKATRFWCLCTFLGLLGRKGQ